LRHNQMQFMQKRSALVAQARTMSQQANKPWAPGANVATETRRISQQPTGAYLSQMSVNSNLPRSSLDKQDSIQQKLDRNYGAAER